MRSILSLRCVANGRYMLKSKAIGAPQQQLLRYCIICAMSLVSLTVCDPQTDPHSATLKPLDVHLRTCYNGLNTVYGAFEVFYRQNGARSVTSRPIRFWRHVTMSRQTSLK